MVAATAGLAEGHQLHMRDAVDLLKSAWDSVTDQTNSGSRCIIPVANRMRNTTVQLGFPPLPFLLRCLVLFVCLGSFFVPR